MRCGLLFLSFPVCRHWTNFVLTSFKKRRSHRLSNIDRFLLYQSVECISCSLFENRNWYHFQEAAATCVLKRRTHLKTNGCTSWAMFDNILSKARFHFKRTKTAAPFRHTEWELSLKCIWQSFYGRQFQRMETLLLDTPYNSAASNHHCELQVLF